VATTTAATSVGDVAKEVAQAAAAAAAAAKAIFGGNSSENASTAEVAKPPSVPLETSVQVVIEANSVDEEVYVAAGVRSKLNASLFAASRDLGAVASHEAAALSLRLRVLGRDVLRKSEGLLDGVLEKLVLLNCSSPWMASFQNATGINAMEVLSTVVTHVAGTCVLSVSPGKANAKLQKALDSAILQAAAAERTAASGEMDKVLHGAKASWEQAVRKALQPTNPTLTAIVKEAKHEGLNISEALVQAIPKVKARLHEEKKLIADKLKKDLAAAKDGLLLAGQRHLEHDLEEAKTFAWKLLKAEHVPSVAELSVQIHTAGSVAEGAIQVFHSYEEAADGARNAQVRAETVKQEAEEAGEAWKRSTALFLNLTKQAAKARAEMTASGAGVNASFVDELLEKANNASQLAGAYAAEQVQDQQLYQQMLTEVVGNTTQELLMATALENSFQEALGAASVAVAGLREAEDGAQEALRMFNNTASSSSRPVSFLGVSTQSGAPGNVTIRVDVSSGNATEIHAVIKALQRRLKAGLLGYGAVALELRHTENRTAGTLVASALVPSLDSAVLAHVTNATAETIRGVLGDVVTDIKKVKIDGLPQHVAEPDEGLPIRAKKPKEEASDSNAEPPGRSSHGPWSLVGLGGIAVLAVLGLLLVCLGRFSG